MTLYFAFILKCAFRGLRSGCVIKSTCVGEKSPSSVNKQRMGGWGRVEPRKEENDANEMARWNGHTFEELTERDMVVLLHSFQGLPLPGSCVAGQGLCDDDDKRWRERRRQLYRGVTITSLSPHFNEHLLTTHHSTTRAQQLTHRKH